MASEFTTTRRITSHKRFKVKTGCITCRVRKVKCDEKKPCCNRCIDTGRRCDGYESPFRVLTTQVVSSTNAYDLVPGLGLASIKPTAMDDRSQEIALLGRYFSIKTLFDIDLGCDAEAKQVMEASLTDVSLRHAFLSLKSLREDLETSGDNSSTIVYHTQTYRDGLQRYGLALRSLSFELANLGSREARSAILCCQMFISIEQVRKNYTTMVQHIIQGLIIMYEFNVRPRLSASSILIVPSNNYIPFLDVFIFKIFAAPCKFAEQSSTETGNVVPSTNFTIPSLHNNNLRIIVPDMRRQLSKIAELMLEFLNKVSLIRSTSQAQNLQAEKVKITNCLEAWYTEFEHYQKDVQFTSAEPVSTMFLRIFYHILNIILLRTLDVPPDVDARLSIEHEHLRQIAEAVTYRVAFYNITCNGKSNG